MGMMNKLKYYILVVAALIKVFTPAIMLLGSAFILRGSIIADLFFILGVCTLGWITDVKLPEKPE
jgi:hypothetical protein